MSNDYERWWRKTAKNGELVNMDNNGYQVANLCWLLASSVPGLANCVALDEAIRCADELSSQHRLRKDARSGSTAAW